MNQDDASNLYCYRDQQRECSADCMAYLANTPAGPDYEEQPWAHCLMLVNSHRTGKHLVVLAANSDVLARKTKVEQADRARQQQVDPPKVV